MNRWLDIAPTAVFGEGTRRVLCYQGRTILVLHDAGQYYAMDNQCTHQAFPLEEGALEDGILTCPYHGAAFCIKTGAVKAPPAFDDLRIYPTRIEKGMVQCLLDSD
jgi:3-phenylpropionate/trans-cinnamate dioxygenase ferredoxin subunit